MPHYFAAPSFYCLRFTLTLATPAFSLCLYAFTFTYATFRSCLRRLDDTRRADASHAAFCLVSAPLDALFITRVRRRYSAMLALLCYAMLSKTSASCVERMRRLQLRRYTSDMLLRGALAQRVTLYVKSAKALLYCLRCATRYASAHALLCQHTRAGAMSFSQLR